MITRTSARISVLSALVGWLAVTSDALAQSSAEDTRLRGVVRDATTGEAIPGAYLRAGEDDSGPAAIADENGAFESEYPTTGAVEIVAIATDYEPVTMRIPRSGRAAAIELLLQPVLADAEGEVIEITESAPELAEAQSYELATEELRSLPGAGNDTLKSIQSLPGASRIPLGLGGLVLRGSSPRDTNVYLDGVEVPLLYHFGGLASFYPSALIDSLEVAPGSFGAEYGRAQGGLVTLTSRPGRTDRWRVASEASLIDASLRADGPGAWGGSWSLGLRRSYVDAVLAAALPSDSDLQFTLAPRYYDGQIRYDVSPTARDDLTFMLFGSDDRIGLRLSDDSPVPDEPSRTRVQTSFVRAAARWQRREGDLLWKVTPWAGIDKYEIKYNDQGQTRTTYPVGLRTSLTNTFAGGRFVAGGLDLQAGRYDLYLRNEPPPRPGVVTGVEIDSDGEPPEVVTKQSIEWITDVGFWLEGLYKHSGGLLNLRPGVRVDYFGLSDEWVVDPRLTVSHELPAEITVKESIGVYHQPPSTVDQDWGNPDLKSSYSVQASVGVSARLPHSLEASVTGFADERYNLPVDVVSAASPLAAGGSKASGGIGAVAAELLDEQFGSWSYRDNVGRGRAHGLELLLKRATSRSMGWVAYTYSRSQRRDDPSIYPDYHSYVLDQPHVLTAVGSTKLGASWRAGARVRYATGNPITPVAGVYYDTDRQEYLPIDGAVLSDRLPDFFQLDLRIDRTWHRGWGELALFLDVQNVTNRLNAEGVEYNFDYSEIQYLRGLPIFPSIGLEYRQ